MKNQYLFVIGVFCKYCNFMKNGNITLESSIKILTDLTMSDLEYCEKNYSSDNKEGPSKQKYDSHLFFDWDSWTFIKKNI